MMIDEKGEAHAEVCSWASTSRTTSICSPWPRTASSGLAALLFIFYRSLRSVVPTRARRRRRETLCLPGDGNRGALHDRRFHGFVLQHPDPALLLRLHHGRLHPQLHELVRRTRSAPMPTPVAHSLAGACAAVAGLTAPARGARAAGRRRASCSRQTSRTSTISPWCAAGRPWSDSTRGRCTRSGSSRSPPRRSPCWCAGGSGSRGRGCCSPAPASPTCCST